MCVCNFIGKKIFYCFIYFFLLLLITIFQRLCIISYVMLYLIHYYGEITMCVSGILIILVIHVADYIGSEVHLNCLQNKKVFVLSLFHSPIFFTCPRKFPILFWRGYDPIFGLSDCQAIIYTGLVFLIFML